MDIFSARVFLPLFYVKYREAWGVRLSSRLPSPRTMLGALTKWLGIILGIESGEELISNEPARKVLSEVIEASSYGFVRPLSPLVKTSQILRIVPAIEQNNKDLERSVIMTFDTQTFLRKVAGFHDAFKHDVILSNEMEFIYVINLKELNESLVRYECREIEVDDVISALKMIDRVGPTEALGGVLSVKYIEHLRKVNSPATINTYAPVENPVKWVEPLQGTTQRYLIEPLYPNLRFISKQRITRETREIKINFILPLAYSERRRGREIFEPSGVLVKPREGYGVYSLDGVDEKITRIVLPERELNG